MAEKKNTNTESKANSSSEKANNTEKTSTSTTTATPDKSPLYGVIGLILGLVVGFIFTTNINETTPTKANIGKGAVGPVKGDEKLPEGHPAVDNEGNGAPDAATIETQAKQAIEAGQLKPDDYETQIKVGTYLYGQTHKLEEAKTYLLKANQLKPEEAEPMIQLGNVYFDLSQETNKPALMVEATQWYEKALKIKPNDINLLTDTGLSYKLREKPEFNKAIEYFDKALAKDPQQSAALYNKTLALIGLKDIKAADETFKLFQDSIPADKKAEFDQLIKNLSSEVEKAKSGNSVPIPSH